MSDSSLQFDKSLLFATGALLFIGLVMVCSASITVADSRLEQPLYFFIRQFAFAMVGLAVAWAFISVRLAVWQRIAPQLLMAGVAMLIMVLIPGIGREVNGSSRWLPLGPVNLQVAELIKLFAIIYIADYLQRHHGQLHVSFLKVLAPLTLLGVAALLLLLQPDMGSMVVIMSTVLAMLFLGGARLDVFATLIGVMGMLFAMLVWIAPYRLERLQSFMDPWADPFGSGFQLTQALIAFGRGDWFGVGLGSSMQKLFYLPEAHTDFLYSIIAEELGLVGALTVIVLFFVFIWRALAIGRAAEQAGQVFGAQIAYGIGIWLGLQACVNIGVNMGALPTKGLTLPLMSYGGSSLVIVCAAIALLFRVDMETRVPEKASARIRR
ncbi:putative lipid II flippase FtsW [Methylophaga thalassica]|jgi:cell division protein FtsW|uniref:Probable peptidoglycan glycosyltransferase FtsW n=2 Tax=Methylophaga TaxID=40222 RepID=F5SVD5_9GAMM|nr:MULTISPECIES: putative lipid II flippase FtsW [Methylophaga]EGL56120.1 bacterial cell division membrane protein [Methylophaga aminisulfidivorans MP]WVI86036.1 putative lipid II flippase FtsW [Methylophaga thalassica]GLP98204.1 putative lipid II flippase FtsW [Methylophaga thalassica]